jgi:hypothetical protein
MRRLAIASLAVPLALLLAVGTVLADTGPGGSGTNFSSFSTTCSTSVSGNCTTKTTTTETSANLTGTITIDGSTSNQDGFLDIFKVTFTIRCK